MGDGRWHGNIIIVVTCVCVYQGSSTACESLSQQQQQQHYQFSRVSLQNYRSKAAVTAVGILCDSGRFIAGTLDGRVLVTH